MRSHVRMQQTSIIKKAIMINDINNPPYIPICLGTNKCCSKKNEVILYILYEICFHRECILINIKVILVPEDIGFK